MIGEHSELLAAGLEGDGEDTRKESGRAALDGAKRYTARIEVTFIHLCPCVQQRSKLKPCLEK